ncbi:polyprenyl synthetase family protein [Streptomyces violascens]|uniref:Serralysin n=1 Tax=Streptomyces violascens TaxID=67381 RepID=A0ABQ3QW51_9ACTN|nr:polyprenyl synthetase family protein [Streptomyces violascens]GGU28024.1 serralysin [Streptomyces violascens]GHI41516.1 serralysin [Streptomyces violascens]
MTEIEASRTAPQAFEAGFRLRDAVVRELDARWPAGADGLDEVCRHSLLPAGKLFRPCLLLASTQAVGGDPMSVLPAAAAAEFGHVGSLIHDDIIDADTVRRGRPAAHRKYGFDEAIVAGDLLFFSLFECLAECRERGVPADRVVTAVTAISRAGMDLCRGQSLEARLTGRRVFEVGPYLEMVRLKTAALFRAACEVGGILGGGGPAALASLVSYANHLGVAFQVHDDLLPYTSDARSAGKAPTSDVRNGRPVLPVILAHRDAGESSRRRIEDCLAGRTDPAEALAALTMILRTSGAIDRSLALAGRHAQAAVAALDGLPLGEGRDLLAEFVTRALAALPGAETGTASGAEADAGTGAKAGAATSTAGNRPG